MTPGWRPPGPDARVTTCPHPRHTVGSASGGGSRSRGAAEACARVVGGAVCAPCWDGAWDEVADCTGVRHEAAGVEQRGAATGVSVGGRLGRCRRAAGRCVALRGVGRGGVTAAAASAAAAAAAAAKFATAAAPAVAGEGMHKVVGPAPGRTDGIRRVGVKVQGRTHDWIRNRRQDGSRCRA